MGAFSLRVDANVVDVKRFLNGIEKDLHSKAIVPALNKTATGVKTEVVRKIAKETGTKQKTFSKKIKIVRARRGTSRSRARNFATVDANEAKAINLIEYVRPGQRKVNFFNKRFKKGYRAAGVVASVGGKRITHKGTFIGTNKAGALKVYRRVGEVRNKITQVPGPSPGGYFKKPETHRFMRNVAERRFPVELNRAARMIIARRSR